jgi:type II secretory pathway pseudopilin PulG
MNPPHISVGRRPRSGIAILWALVVLSVLGVMSASVAWHFVAVRRTLEGRQNRIQALWLARSGAELAAARLLADPDGYAGEVVEPIPEGQVRITVEKDPDRPNTYRIRCEAHYPAGDLRPVGLTLTWSATRQTDPAGVRLELVAPGEHEGS